MCPPRNIRILANPVTYSSAPRIRESLLLSVAGLIIGAPCAIATTRLMAHMLFGVTPGDPLILALASSALLAVGAVAGYWPARRAAKIDPMVALRCE